MNFRSTLLITATSAAVLTCPAGKVLNPDFELEIVHLQDVTAQNSEAIKKISNVYSSAVENLMDTFKGKVKFGYSAFSDDESPDGNAEFASYNCLDVKQQPKVISSPKEIQKSIKQLKTVKDYDNYNCGYKALVLSSYSGKNSMVDWSAPSADRFRLLSLATNGPGKKAFDPWGCPLITDFQNCPGTNACARFRDITSNGTYRDTPIEADLYRYADRDIHYVNIVMNADGKDEANAKGEKWWSELSDGMFMRNYNIMHLEDKKLKKAFTQYLEQTVMESACEDPVESQSPQSVQPASNESNVRGVPRVR